jgi:hypothetical protein
MAAVPGRHFHFTPSFHADGPPLNAFSVCPEASITKSSIAVQKQRTF